VLLPRGAAVGFPGHRKARASTAGPIRAPGHAIQPLSARNCSRS